MTGLRDADRGFDDRPQQLPSNLAMLAFAISELAARLRTRARSAKDNLLGSAPEKPEPENASVNSVYDTLQLAQRNLQIAWDDVSIIGDAVNRQERGGTTQGVR